MSASIARVFSAELQGVDAEQVTVEVDINVGLSSFTIVGLADKALSEARERVNSALKNSGFKPPSKDNRRITVNLAPADVAKSGSQYDLAIAVGYLVATGQIVPEGTLEEVLLIGELSLDGTLRRVQGALNSAHHARERGMSELIVPEENAAEAGLIRDIRVTPARTLGEVIAHLEGGERIEAWKSSGVRERESHEIVLEQIRGQESAKRVLLIAAAGGHNLLMVGPPGSGKTILAKSLPSILPDLDEDEIIEVAKVWSAAGLLSPERPYLTARPFRHPHHTASASAIVGGGTNPRPGEISLAHRGVLFLDELPEFRRDILESLREPIESGEVTIARARANLRFPARFQFVSAMNPCPCGYYGDPEHGCSCSSYDVFRYQRKVSGPLLDRIDLQITVPRVKIEHLRGGAETKTDDLRARVARARARQRARFAEHGSRAATNSDLSSKECEKTVRLTRGADEFLKKVFDQSLLSARSYYRLLKTAQTIADLEEADAVTENHTAEAFQYRLKTNKQNTSP